MPELVAGDNVTLTPVGGDLIVSSGGVGSVSFSDPGTEVTTDTGAYRWYAPHDLTITKAILAQGMTGTITVDVNKNGTTIFTTQANRPATSNSNMDEAVPDVTAVLAGDYLTVNVDVRTAGSAVTVTILYTY